MNLIFKIACALVYALALASLADMLPPGRLDVLPTVALVLLAIHALELILYFRHVRLYAGPIGISIALTLLFGLLHWKPLADANAKARANA